MCSIVYVYKLCQVYAWAKYREEAAGGAKDCGITTFQRSRQSFVMLADVYAAGASPKCQ